MKVFLSVFVRHASFSLAHPDEPWAAFPILKPKHGMPMTVSDATHGHPHPNIV